MSLLPIFSCLFGFWSGSGVQLLAFFADVFLAIILFFIQITSAVFWKKDYYTLFSFFWQCKRTFSKNVLSPIEPWSWPTSPYQKGFVLAIDFHNRHFHPLGRALNAIYAPHLHSNAFTLKDQSCNARVFQSHMHHSQVWVGYFITKFTTQCILCAGMLIQEQDW